jgi:DNA-binding CsgD family transcriptional regulator
MMVDCDEDIGGFEKALGVMVVTADATVVRMNSAARQLLDAGRYLVLSAGRIQAVSSADTRTLYRLIDGASRSAIRSGMFSQGVLRMLGRGGGSPLDALVVPCWQESTSSISDRRSVVIYLIDSVRWPNVCGRPLAHMYGLTPAEKRVLALIAEGCNGTEAAERLGLAYNTVKTHIARIYAKAGIRRRGELIRLMVQ